MAAATRERSLAKFDYSAAYSGLAPAPAPRAIHTIKHVVIIMQETRSFDSYFGTYPGADGFMTMRGRHPGPGRASSP